jgi:hypothetical protein
MSGPVPRRGRAASSASAPITAAAPGTSDTVAWPIISTTIGVLTASVSAAIGPSALSRSARPTAMKPTTNTPAAM